MSDRNYWETRQVSKQLLGHRHISYGQATLSDLTHMVPATRPTWAKSISMRHYLQMPLLRSAELLWSDAMYLLFTSLKHWLMTLIEEKEPVPWRSEQFPMRKFLQQKTCQCLLLFWYATTLVVWQQALLSRGSTRTLLVIQQTYPDSYGPGAGNKSWALLIGSCCHSDSKSRDN